jgi:DNA-binding winged helix-turn-helix (wHTH) protein
MDQEAGSAVVYVFGSFRLVPRTLKLTKEENEVDLDVTPRLLLLALVERAGEVVSQNDLLKKGWGSAGASPANLYQQISILRKTLGEGPKDNTYIMTVPCEGYRFVAEVKAAWNGPSEFPPIKRAAADFLGNPLRDTLRGFFNDEELRGIPNPEGLQVVSGEGVSEFRKITAFMGHKIGKFEVLVQRYCAGFTTDEGLEAGDLQIWCETNAGLLKLIGKQIGRRGLSKVRMLADLNIPESDFDDVNPPIEPRSPNDLLTHVGAVKSVIKWVSSKSDEELWAFLGLRLEDGITILRSVMHESKGSSDHHAAIGTGS